MARLAPAALAALVFAMALAAWAPATQAGTPDAPEITDPPGDQVLIVLPVDQVGFSSADVVAGWIAEDADNLLFNIELSGEGVDGAGGPYSWNFHCTAGSAEVEATGTSSADQPTPSGAATAASRDGSVITLTVPRTTLAGVTELTGCHIEAVGGTPAQIHDPLAVSDTAPDDGEDGGISYSVTGGGSAGPPGDSDGDGLNDTKEVEQFGGIGAQNGTGDPDGDGLNNTQEFGMGTNATKADTDGDGLDDKEDSDPLDPLKPGTGGNGTGGGAGDTDRDGLPDDWERTNFDSTTAQTGASDPDQDGLDNAAEFSAGTDPNEADTDGDGLSDSTDPKPLTAETEGEDRVEMYAGAPMFAAIATLCLFALARK